MLLGFNMLLWSTHVTEEHFPIFADIKRAGYDGVELPIFEGTPEHFFTAPTHERAKLFLSQIL